MLTIYKNTDAAWSETFTKDGSAVNLTGYTSITLYIYKNISDSAYTKSIVGSVADAANGIVNFELDILDNTLSGKHKGQYIFIDGSGEKSASETFEIFFKPRASDQAPS